MKLPRDIAGEELAKRLAKLGYVVTRQTGSHLRLTHRSAEETHHVTIPRHKELKVGTLSRILKDIAQHMGLEMEELLLKLGRD